MALLQRYYRYAYTYTVRRTDVQKRKIVTHELYHNDFEFTERYDIEIKATIAKTVPVDIFGVVSKLLDKSQSPPEDTVIRTLQN